MAIRKGYDTSPLLNQTFQKAEIDFIKGVAPEALDNPENTPELLIHTLKRIHRNPTALMITYACQQTGMTQEQVCKVWEAMWSRA